VELEDEEASGRWKLEDEQASGRGKLEDGASGRVKLALVHSPTPARFLILELHVPARFLILHILEDEDDAGGSLRSHTRVA
jgi:hypothetical protein